MFYLINRSSQSLSSLLFSYKAHIDEEAAADDDSLSLPQQFPSNPRLDSTSGYLDNTNLDQTSTLGTFNIIFFKCIRREKNQKIILNLVKA